MGCETNVLGVSGGKLFIYKAPFLSVLSDTELLQVTGVKAKEMKGGI